MSRILIVEDNEMNRDMLARRLAKRGFEVSCGVNGVEGIELARRVRPDVILMDLSLPVMDGWQTANKLKSDDATRSIPIIALTAHALPEDRQRALSSGCDDYDTKPIELARLLEKISRLLPEQGGSL